MAGIPNITGSYRRYSEVMCDSSTSGDGPFSVVNNGDSGPVVANTQPYPRFFVTFDASKCSPVYGSSDTITPLSLSCKYLISY